MFSTNKPKILAIETSCDETSAAVVEGVEVLSNVIFSQLDLHKAYGGVVPSIARTAHEQKLPQIVESALEQSGVEIGEIDFVAVTKGPGLAIALEVGVKYAKNLAEMQQVPLLGINHMEGHLLSVLAGVKDEPSFPALGLLVSGGHTEFVRVDGVGEYQKIGWTLDDACGEAFDKAANMLGLGYPGGPVISKLAAQGRESLRFELEREQQSLYMRAYDQKTDEFRFELPIPMANSGDLHMSYSGLKTAMKQLVNQLGEGDMKNNIRETAEQTSLSEELVIQLATLFEEAAVTEIIIKLEKALISKDFKELWMGGGVINNRVLVDRAKQVAQKYDVDVRVPPNGVLNTDNAGMIGIAASYFVAMLEQESGKDQVSSIYLTPDSFDELDRDPNLSL